MQQLKPIGSYTIPGLALKLMEAGPTKTVYHPIHSGSVERAFSGLLGKEGAPVCGSETMGWVWRDEPDDDVRDVFRSSSPSGDISVFGLPEAKLEDRCSTRKIVKTQCRTEEVEPGKFIRKCEKTEQILKDCLGRPSEVVQSNKEYTEDDVTDEILNKKPPSLLFNDSDDGLFSFPGLRGDIESIERSFFNNIRSFFNAADDIRNGFFSVFGTPNVGDREASTSSTRRRIPVEDFPSKLPSHKSESSDSGSIDFSGLARDV